MKKALAILAAAGAGAYYFGRKTVDKYSDSLSKLKFKFIGLNNLKLRADGIYFNSDLQLNNESANNINIDTYNTAVLKKLRFYTKSKENLGEATPSINNINIPSNGCLTIKNIPTFIPVSHFGNIFSSAYEVFKYPKDIFIEIELEALGRTIILEA